MSNEIFNKGKIGGVGNTRDFALVELLAVERKFSNATMTPLEVEVVAGKNNFKLDVGSAVEIVEKHTSPLGR